MAVNKTLIQGSLPEGSDSSICALYRHVTANVLETEQLYWVLIGIACPKFM